MANKPTAMKDDAIGNPTTWYDGTTFTWVNGRRLASATNTAENLTATYTYDSDGLRLTKTINGVEHKYLWQGSKLVSEYYDGKELEFFYDESGNPYAFSYKASSTATPVTYYYLTNLQGDVTGILDASGTSVGAYTYNAWGKLLSSTGDMASINPLRYRGYYYDAETGLYYVSSRYYDPEIGRWINADSNIVPSQGFLGYNMFAYCNNNPIKYDDQGGEWIEIAIGAAVGGLIGGISAALKGGDAGDIIESAAVGALTGGLTAARGIYSAMGAAVNAVYTFVTTEGSTKNRLIKSVFAFASTFFWAEFGNTLSDALVETDKLFGTILFDLEFGVVAEVISSGMQQTVDEFLPKESAPKKKRSSFSININQPEVLLL